MTTQSERGYISPWMDDDLRLLGQTAARFMEANLVAPREKLEAQHHVDRDMWRKAGEIGLLCCSIPEEYGGGGGTFLHDLMVLHEQGRSLELGWGNAVHSGIVAHYLLAYGTEEQRRRWLPRMASGDLVAAIAMSEPGTGSDLKAIATRAVRGSDGDYRVSGAKTFITNGSQADLVVVVAKTDPGAGAQGLSLLVLETEGCEGFHRGRLLEKIGQPVGDTTELYFDEARVPAANLLGGAEGQGFVQLTTQLAQERLIVAVHAAAIAERAVEETVSYTKQRTAFGAPLFQLQNTRFELAECATLAHACRVFVDSCISRHALGSLDAATAAMAKYWSTDVQCQIIDRCVQLHGGYGYMAEYPIARMYRDARVQRIYGGANEIMKELIARSL